MLLLDTTRVSLILNTTEEGKKIVELKAEVMIDTNKEPVLVKSIFVVFTVKRLEYVRT